ncbi:uncharacterized protein LOC132631352 [Lycium barbarum]|uniref:uncharacterized protein LOC132631352 n=1 Tax=Lycium barbarum TaxID=112863 RepID=UPI00293E4E7B|nr:uncharacterized protein LOC132631352 [Lycium barbarum]
MEYLTRLLKPLQQDKRYQFHPKCAKLKIIQLSFADDLLLFSKGDTTSVQLLMERFNHFSQASGLQANLNKCSIYFGGVKQVVQDQILAVTGMGKGELPIKKKDVLWIQWVHIFYGKWESLWGKRPKQASWIVQKVLKVQQYIETAGMDETELVNIQSFSIKKMYLKLLGDHPKVSWRRVTCNNPGLPKWIFILFLALHRRLYTKNRLISWGMPISPLCALCGTEPKSIDHLFFKCSVSEYIWRKLLIWQSISRSTMPWANEIQWCEAGYNGKGCTATI